MLHIHELLQYLNRQGTNTFLTVAQHGLVGDMKTPVDVTYLADTVILLRYFEAKAQVRRAISVIKKRAGRHEDTIREYRIGDAGLTIGYRPFISSRVCFTACRPSSETGGPLMSHPEGSEAYS